jgi:hypothetical protein
MADVAHEIIGTWRLVHSIEITPGNETHYPFGSDAIGYIYYSETGVMAVQISWRGRKPVTDPSNLVHEYLAYFGHYEIDTERQVVRHIVEGELFPGVHGEILERRYRFEGDLMSLKPVDGTNREILWQRVPKP